MLATMVMMAGLAAVPAGDARATAEVPVSAEVLEAASAHLADEALTLDDSSYLLAMGATAAVDLLAAGGFVGGAGAGFVGLLLAVGGDEVKVTPASRAIGVPLAVVGGTVAVLGGVLALAGAPVASSYLLASKGGTFTERMERALPGILAGGALHLVALGLLAFAATAPVSAGFYPLLGAAAALDVVGMPLAAWAAIVSAAPVVPVVAAEF